jgi:hypothetical protein
MPYLPRKYEYVLSMYLLPVSKFREVSDYGDRLCGLVVTVPVYRFWGPGSIHGAIRFSEYWVWNGVHSASWAQLRSYLKEKVAAPV